MEITVADMADDGGEQASLLDVGMGLELEKSEKALNELRNKGLA